MNYCIDLCESEDSELLPKTRSEQLREIITGVLLTHFSCRMEEKKFQNIRKNSIRLPFMMRSEADSYTNKRKKIQKSKK